MKNEPNLVVLIEGNSYENNLPKEAVHQLLKRQICIVDGNYLIFKVVGIFIYKNSFYIVFPKTYKAPSSIDKVKKHAQLLYKVLMKYRKESLLDNEEISLLGGQSGNFVNSITVANEIINDYMINGILDRRLEIKTTDSAIIDWNYTINRKQPIIAENTVAYLDTIGRKRVTDNQNLIMLIHKYCIYESLHKYGWLMDLTASDFGLEDIELTVNINYALNKLYNELNQTFVEREIYLINLLITFLNGIKFEEEQSKIDVFVTPFFHNVWEQMCSQIFKNDYNILKQYIPRLNWTVKSQGKVQTQIPDILFIRNNTLYILDAKYYDITTNLPGWPDVVKQFFYSITIFNNIVKVNNDKNITNVSNIFLFPSSEIKSINYIGKVNVENNSDLGDIYSYELNLLQVMQSYIGEINVDFISQLIKDNKK